MTLSESIQKFDSVLQETIRAIPPLLYAGRKGRRTYLRLRWLREFYKLSGMPASASERLSLQWSDRKVCIDEWLANHDFDRHYVYHPAWATRIIANEKPSVHVDISSTLHFCSILSAFIPVQYYEFRKINLQLTNLTSSAIDLLNLSFSDSSIDSLSCMHVVEHVGLGRYGDPLDPDGDLKAIAELKRVLAINGNLLFVVPIGKPRIMFNAHRIYSYKQVMTYFEGLALKEFALIPDNSRDGELVVNASEEMVDRQSYGCGCFWFTKF